jgi:hypothetical protein
MHGADAPALEHVTVPDVAKPAAEVTSGKRVQFVRGMKGQEGS